MARWLGRPDAASALAEARALLEQAREETRRALATRGAEPRDAQARYAQAMSRIAALARRPHSGAGLLRLAAAAAAESGLEDPLPYLDRLAAIADLDARTRGELGMLYLGAGALERAREALERALHEAPQEALVRANRGLLALGARDYERGWRAGDAAGVAALFSEDGMALPSGRPPAPGRPAIIAAYQGPGGDLRLRALAFATADSVGYIIGAYRYGDGTGDLGKFVLALTRRGTGPWMIAADLDNTNAPSAR